MTRMKIVIPGGTGQVGTILAHPVDNLSTMATTRTGAVLRRALVAAAAWLAILGIAHLLARSCECTWTELPRRAADLPPTGAAGALLALYLLRPILLVPAPVVCLAAGAAFGPWVGAAMTWIGENLGAQLAFGIARAVGPQRGAGAAADANAIPAGWRSILAHRGVVCVVLMRLSFLPHDAINYGCGLSPLRFRDFALGTALGILPGVVVFSVAGGSITGQGSRWAAGAIAAATIAAAAVLARSLWRTAR